MVRIITIGGEFVNKGSEAMILSTKFLLSKYFEDLDFTVASYSHKMVDSEYSGINIIYNGNLKAKILLLGKAMITKLAPFMKNIFKDSLFRKFEETDLIIDISGYGLTEDFGLKRISLYCTEILLSKLLSKPFIIFPQSMGPFNSKLSKFLVRVFIPYVDLIIVRGKESKKYLKELGICNKKKVYIYPDIAFLFKASPKRRAIEILKENNISVYRNLVGIVPNKRVYERSFVYTRNEYVDILKKIINLILERADTAVVLIPHEFRADGLDDREVIMRIIGEVKSKDRIYALTEEISSADLKAIIGCMDLLIASRFHSIVSGFSMRVPTMVLGWSHKYLELANMVDQEELVVDYKDLEINKVERMVSELWINKDNIRRVLESKVPELEIEAEKIALLVKSILEEHNIHSS